MQTEQIEKDVRQNINKFYKKIREIALQCGRNPDEITLVGVTKSLPIQYAAAACKAGLKNLGENRVQELTQKIEDLKKLDLNPDWHMIGTLQRNKVKFIIGKTKLIHSVHSKKLLENISKLSVDNSLVTDILLQVNVSQEESKHGFSKRELIEGIEQLATFPGVRIRGLMTMAPLAASEEELNTIFSQTKELSLKLKEQVGTDDLNILSMGMSQDYRQAIICGATHIRIGSALFGDRPR